MKQKLCISLAAWLCCTVFLSGCFRDATPKYGSLESDEIADTVEATDGTSRVPVVSQPGTDPDTAIPQNEAPVSPPDPHASEIDPGSFFDNSLFIGDSVLEGISKYVRVQRNQGVDMLSDAKFLTSVTGIRIADLVGDIEDDPIRYTYKGKEQELIDIVSDIQPDRIFLFLGMNDLAWGYTVEETIGRYERLLQMLQENFPGTYLVVMTVTPKTDTQYLPWYCQNKEFGSRLLNSLAEELIALCVEKQIAYVDTNAAIRDENGNLPMEYSNDQYVHVNNAGAAVLISTLENYAIQELGNS